jgi:hypothetical protein
MWWRQRLRHLDDGLERVPHFDGVLDGLPVGSITHLERVGIHGNGVSLPSSTQA